MKMSQEQELWTSVVQKLSYLKSLPTFSSGEIGVLINKKVRGKWSFDFRLNELRNVRTLKAIELTEDENFVLSRYVYPRGSVQNR
jgi:hypothetical protein